MGLPVLVSCLTATTPCFTVTPTSAMSHTTSESAATPAAQAGGGVIDSIRQVNLSNIERSGPEHWSEHPWQVCLF
jgi:hypothetical protein